MQNLLNFWGRHGFRSVYVRQVIPLLSINRISRVIEYFLQSNSQTANELTGEHSAIVLRALRCDDLEDAPQPEWLDLFVEDAKVGPFFLRSYLRNVTLTLMIFPASPCELACIRIQKI